MINDRQLLLPPEEMLLHVSYYSSFKEKQLVSPFFPFQLVRLIWFTEMFPDVVTVNIQRWSGWSTYILINVLCLYLQETSADHINASCLYGDITSKPSILGLLQVVFALTLQPKIVTSSLESLLDESRCVHLHNLIQTSTTSCNDPTGICMNICVVVKDYIICYKVLCVQLAYAHKVDQIINKPLYRFSPTFFTFSCAGNM